MSDGPVPDLSPEEVALLLGRLSQLTDEGRTVVVGGQAVYFWAWLLASKDDSLLEGAPPTSGDLDLCGTKDSVIRAAELLGGEPRLPGVDDHTPSAGIVRFRDSKGHDRILDVVTDPYGLRRREVVKYAVRVEYQPGTRRSVYFWVMNPIHCLQSRVHNVIGLHLDHPHGLHQLDVAIPCAREFLRMLLLEESVELATRRRRVMAWNNVLYRFAKSDRDAQTLYRERGIDPFDAVLVDERLSRRFQEDGYRRWREDLEGRRERARQARERRARH